MQHEIVEKMLPGINQLYATKKQLIEGSKRLQMG